MFTGIHGPTWRPILLARSIPVLLTPQHCDFAHFSNFLRAVISLSNDVPYVSWTPNLNTNGEVRVYTVMGKTNLTDAAWMCPTNAAHRFFKVKVEMP